jgi:hypothetical protein
MSDSPTPQIQIWHIDRFVFYARNPRKNDAAVDRMCASIREFDRHRGGGHPPTPATPPCVRVRTRRFESVTLTLLK